MEEATISWFPYLEFATDTSMIDTYPTLILDPDRPFHINIGQRHATLSSDRRSTKLKISVSLFSSGVRDV